ncbi:hypothetical protein DFH07DRAFT_813690 [Mycena maculata]|uniref:Uncharacterized protein n=1 Tax=Mycena maculata TaxID=230809 RepID=A0AAD7JHL9_9AGAR|nr:hypothetical protein DFH07DRAFT_813690 [Mycena maculata]
MSLSMDDLCASMSASHVGQEAMDLAALQVQLAQTLFCQSMSSTSIPQRKDDYAQPCNTPTTRTPSASFSWGQMVDSSRYSELAPRRNPEDHSQDETEDERMVEDLLIPTSPMSPKQQTPAAGRSQQSSPSYTSSDASPSLFTTTDPFYIAQLQAAQNYGVSPPSVFSQAAFPSQQSPFFIHPNYQRHSNAQNPLSLDTHALLVAASSFDR